MNSRIPWLSLSSYLACVGTGLLILWSGAFDMMDRQMLDAGFTLQRAHFPQPAHNDVVLVGIDEAFLKSAPEPLALLHEHLGNLFSALAEARPRAVGLDIVLPSKSFSFLTPVDRPDFDFDRALARGLLKLGTSTPLVVAETWDHERGRFHDIHPAFAAAASHWVTQRGPVGFRPFGSALMCPDQDGRVREYPGAGCQPGGSRETLSSQLVGLLDRGRTDWEGFIHYGIGAAFTYVPGRDVIAWQQTGNRLRLDALRDKLVLVGTVLDNEDRLKAPAALAGWEPDNFRLPGVTIQAQAIRSMMNQGLVQPAPVALLVGLIFLAATFAFGGRIGPKLIVFIVFVVSLVVGAFLLLRATIFLPPVSILATGVLALLASSAGTAHRNWRERRHLTQTFAGYVSPEVLKGILAGSLSQGRAGEKRHVCVLFSDIRGFTTLSETLPADGVMELLNRYFDTMSKIVHEHQGMVDKFIGDGMMAVFGAPEALACPEKNALEAAHEMLLALQDLNTSFRSCGLPNIDIGIGLHSGTAVIGHVGSSHRHEYTAIGDTVNVAARLCGLPAVLKIPIVCSTKIAEALGHPAFLRDCGLQALKGHSDVHVFGWNPLAGHK